MQCARGMRTQQACETCTCRICENRRGSVFIRCMMAESLHYNLQFQHPDPVAREATSRTTRYRLLKRRRAAGSASHEQYVNVTCTGLPATTPVTDDVTDNFTSSEEISGTVQECLTFNTVTYIYSCIDTLLNSEEQRQEELREQDGEEEEEQEELQQQDEEEEEEEEEEKDDDSEEEVDRREQDTMTSAAAMDISSSSGPAAISPYTLLVKQYCMRHRLTQAALGDLLQLLRAVDSSAHGGDDVLPVTLRSVSRFEKQFKPLSYAISCQYYCCDCLEKLPNKGIPRCPNEACQKVLNSASTVCTFIQIPLEEQLINLFQSIHACIYYYASMHERRVMIMQGRQLEKKY